MRMPAAEGGREREATSPFPLEEGVCYLVRGKSVESTFRLAHLRARDGLPVLCVSRIHPERLRAKYGLADAELWWISETPGHGYFDPTAVGTLSSAIEGFIEGHPDGCLVVLDGVEYIAINIGFTKTILFIEHLNEFVMPRQATMLVPVDPECFDPQEFARLDRFTGGISEEELRNTLDAFEANRDLDED